MGYTNMSLISLFLQASVQDAKEDYARALSDPRFPHWDAVILTASNSLQALGYQKQIEYRKNLKLLPSSTEFIILPDEGNKRVGSGGSTLSVICTLKQKYGSLADRRFLVIHAGGNSARCPQYSALGKLFAPLPTVINGIPATLFDMFLITMASVPGRLRDGMLLLSGDVTLLFNPLQCDFGSCSAAVISFKEDVETGKDHGVYVRSPTGNVKKFLHKQTVERLKAEGAVDERNMCSIDTGAMWLCPEILEKLYSLVDTEEKYRSLVNDKVRLSLYSDIAYCLAEDLSLEDFYNETPEGEFCEELMSARRLLWETIGGYNMKLMNLAPAKFVHFGSIPEILRLMNRDVADYDSIGWNRQILSSVGKSEPAAYCSVVGSGAKVGEGTYLEVSNVHSGAVVGRNSYISYVDIPADESIPDNILLHGLKQRNGKFVCRIMGTDDNPKKDRLFGVELSAVSVILGADLDNCLWTAELYPECEDIRSAVAAALNLYKLIVERTGDVEAWKAAAKKSLMSGFNDADPQAILDWSAHMADLVKMEELKKHILLTKPASDARTVLNASALTEIQKKWLENELSVLNTNKLSDFSYAIRLYYYLGAALGDEAYTSSCFTLIADTVLHSALKHLRYNESARIVKEEALVRLPLRINFGGGWSDTCPHCLENGGAVLNAAILLNGKYPVEVRLVKITEKKIIFDSRDMDTHGEFDTVEPLQKTGDPFDPFALQKACLLACGILPMKGGNLSEILDRLGGGFEMHSEVTGVPKGSGLGTSSILSAAAVKAVTEFTGMEYTEDELYSTVLAMEQLMSTGGGWQDQVGGATAGIKLCTSRAGINQKIKVEHIEISEETKKELRERFAVIYTGQRRLARNLLRDVVGRYVGSEPDSIFAHKEIQKTAVWMKLALENGDVDEFAGLLDRHWSLSQKIDAGSTNTLIDQIFMVIDDLIDAKMCCGAGGGGFLQVILKKGVSRAEVHERLKDVFHDFDVDIWDAEIVYE